MPKARSTEQSGFEVTVRESNQKRLACSDNTGENPALTKADGLTALHVTAQDGGAASPVGRRRAPGEALCPVTHQHAHVVHRVYLDITISACFQSNIVRIKSQPSAQLSSRHQQDLTWPNMAVWTFPVRSNTRPRCPPQTDTENNNLSAVNTQHPKHLTVRPAVADRVRETAAPNSADIVHHVFVSLVLVGHIHQILCEVIGNILRIQSLNLFVPGFQGLNRKNRPRTSDCEVMAWLLRAAGAPLHLATRLTTFRFQ